MLKAIKKIYVTLSAAALLWLVLRYIEILFRNVYGGATYSDYNIIVNAINYINTFTGGIF